MTSQLSLNLDLKSDASLSDFAGLGWATLLDAVRQMHVGLLRQMYVYGSPSTGKTHFLTAICESYIEMGKTAICLSLKDLVSTDTAVLNALENFDLIAIDDLDVIGRNRAWQEAIFHLINRNLSRQMSLDGASVDPSANNSGQLVFSASVPASELPFTLSDLMTRLIQAPAFRVPSGHDLQDRRALLESVLNRQGWHFDDRITDYLLQEGPHHVGGMLSILTAIAPMFSNLSRAKVSKIVIEDAIAMIDEQTLLAELEDITQEAQADYLQKNDGMTRYDDGLLSI